MSIYTNVTQIRGKAKRILVIGMPFPLQAQLPCVEFITLNRCLYRISPAYIRLFISFYRFTTPISILVLPNHGPIIFPLHRIQVQNSTIHSFILKIDKPRLACTSFHPSSLMRTIYICISLSHNNFQFVWAIHITRTKCQLPTCHHPSCRSQNVSITFVKLRPLDGVIHPIITIKNQYRFTNDFCTSRIHLTNRNHTIECGTTARPRMYQIHFSILIPQRSRIYHSFPGLYQDRLFPFTQRIFSLYHENTPIGISPIDKKLTVVVTDRRSPYPFSMLRSVKEAGRLYLLQGIVCQTPVDQIL